VQFLLGMRTNPGSRELYPLI